MSYAQIAKAPKPVYAADLEAEMIEQSALTRQKSMDDSEDLNDEQFLDALDEVHTRFVLNVPQEELGTSERIFFQLEQAWWYYEDLICDKLVRCISFTKLTNKPQILIEYFQ